MKAINGLAIIAASIAALAGSIQAYVSWLSRNDSLKSSLLSEVVRQCAAVHISSQALLRFRRENVKLIEDGRFAKSEDGLIKEVNELGGAILAADAAIHILNPKAPDIAALMDPLIEASEAHQNAKKDTRINAVNAEKQLFLLRHTFCRLCLEALLPQQGHRGRVLMSALIRRTRMVAIEFAM
jgi:hypothetical protein